MMGAVPKLGRELEGSFQLHRYWREADGEAFLRAVGRNIRALVTYTGMRRTDAALLDLLSNLDSVAAEAPQVHRFQHVADPRLRPLAPAAPERHPRIDDWGELGEALARALAG